MGSTWTKRQIVEEAFGELALAAYDFDLTPEELQAGLRRLDMQMAMWVGLGINLGYAFGLTPADSDLDQDSGLPLIAMEAAYTNLACRIAGSKGKQIPPSLRLVAKNALDAVMLYAANINDAQQQLRSGMPAGAGSRRGARPFICPPTDDTFDTLGN